MTERRWLYADSKAMDEFLALGFHQERGLDCVIARFFNTVGPRQQGQYGMVIPRFVGRALAGEPLEVHGDGTQTRSFCHVQDTIRAVHGLMEAGDLSGQIFNIGSAERVRILDLAHRVLELTRSGSDLPFVPHEEVYELGVEDVLHREPSIEKIGAAIGWAPTRSLDEILADVIAFERGKVEAAASTATPRTARLNGMCAGCCSRGSPPRPSSRPSGPAPPPSARRSRTRARAKARLGSRAPR